MRKWFEIVICDNLVTLTIVFTNSFLGARRAIAEVALSFIVCIFPLPPLDWFLLDVSCITLLFLALHGCGAAHVLVRGDLEWRPAFLRREIMSAEFFNVKCVLYSRAKF